MKTQRLFVVLTLANLALVIFALAQQTRKTRVWGTQIRIRTCRPGHPSGARDTQPLQAGLTCAAPPALWRKAGGIAFGIGWRALGCFVFHRARLLRDAGLSPQKTWEVPGKGNRNAEGTPHKPGQSPALHCARGARRRGLFAA